MIESVCVCVCAEKREEFYFTFLLEACGRLPSEHDFMAGFIAS